MVGEIRRLVICIFLLAIALAIPNGFAFWELAWNGEFSKSPLEISVGSIRMMYFAVTVDMIVLIPLLFATYQLWCVVRKIPVSVKV